MLGELLTFSGDEEFRGKVRIEKTDFLDVDAGLLALDTYQPLDVVFESRSVFDQIERMRRTGYHFRLGYTVIIQDRIAIFVQDRCCDADRPPQHIAYHRLDSRDNDTILDFVNPANRGNHERSILWCYLYQGAKLLSHSPALNLEKHGFMLGIRRNRHLKRLLYLRNTAFLIHCQLIESSGESSTVLPRLDTGIDQSDIVDLPVDIVLARVQRLVPNTDAPNRDKRDSQLTANGTGPTGERTIDWLVGV